MSRKFAPKTMTAGGIWHDIGRLSLPTLVEQLQHVHHKGPFCERLV